MAHSYQPVLRREKKTPNSRPNKDIKRTQDRGGLLYWRSLAILALERWRKEDQELKTILSYTVSSRHLGEHETVSRYKTNKIQAKQSERIEFEVRSIMTFITPETEQKIYSMNLTNFHSIVQEKIEI